MPVKYVVEIGTKFLDYEVVSLLGEGGMSEVYLVRKDDEYYALKLLSPTLAKSNPEYVKRFEREARIAMRLNHPNLVGVYDVGFNEEFGRHYIVMDYINGCDLRSVIALGGAMDPKNAVDVILAVAGALAAGEALGLVHRDIKPENIMVEDDGTIKLLDMGVAKARGTDSLSTMPRTVFGTPSYISPEQAQDASMVDSRADIYSLGVVLYELLAGERPYECESTKDILAQLLSGEEIPDIRQKHPEVPEKLAALLCLMLAKDPEKRIASASKLLEVLKKLGYEAPCKPDGAPRPRHAPKPEFSYSSLDKVKPDNTLSFDTKDEEIRSFVDSLKTRRRNRRLFRAAAISLAVILAVTLLVMFLF
jgi:serine/threonine-protein kinase